MLLGSFFFFRFCFCWFWSSKMPASLILHSISWYLLFVRRNTNEQAKKKKKNEESCEKVEEAKEATTKNSTCFELFIEIANDFLQCYFFPLFAPIAVYHLF